MRLAPTSPHVPTAAAPPRSRARDRASRNRPRARFGRRRPQPNAVETLFSEYDLSRVLDNQREKLKQAVEKLGRDEILGVSETDLVQHLVSEFEVTVPTLHREAMYAEERETKIDVSGDPGRDVRGGRSVYLPGTEVTIVVPFSGDGALFQCRPNQYRPSHPRAVVASGTISLVYTAETINAESMKTRIEGDLTEIELWLGWQRGQISPFNQELPRFAEAQVSARRDRLIAAEGAIADIGIPVRRKGDRPTTFVVPEVRQRPKINVPRPQPTEPYVAEPTLAIDTYDEILRIISDMARVMEQSPHAFAELDEESLRFQFLVPLNGHFEGSASGETFNYDGKTDILIKSAGKIIFVAECKIWAGPKALAKTIDQIRGYLSWRDTKAAVLLFVRNRDFSAVVSQVVPAVEAHPGWKKTIGQTDETAFRFIIGHRDDSNREIMLSVLLFLVPTPQSTGSAS